MIDTRTLTLAAVGLALFTAVPQGQDRSRYRDSKLGGDVPSVSAVTKVALSEVKTIHQRPCLDAGKCSGGRRIS